MTNIILYSVHWPEEELTVFGTALYFTVSCPLFAVTARCPSRTPPCVIVRCEHSCRRRMLLSMVHPLFIRSPVSSDSDVDTDSTFQAKINSNDDSSVPSPLAKGLPSQIL